MSFRIFGTKIYISFLFSAFICIMLLFDKTGLILPTLLSAFIHELGHLFAMWLCNCPPKEIKFIPASMQIIRSFPQRPNGELIIALFGPLCNLLLFCVFYFNFLSTNESFALQFALLNLIIGIFNLLPLKGLDGGTVLELLLSKFLSVNKATLIIKAITFITALLILLAAVYLTINHKLNLSAYIISLYLFIVTLFKR